MKLRFGKYRGTVRNNVDPDNRGRLLVNVPLVMGEGTDWALPCFPYTGLLAGCFIVPPINAAVWVEFEAGNPSKPIWVGGFYPKGHAPPPMALAAPPGTQEFVIQTTLRNVVSVKDVPGPAGGILIQASSGAMIMVNDAGIVLQDGKGGSIVMASGIVSINAPNLVVTK